MVSEDLQKQLTELGEKYWQGKENFIIRYITYLRRGNALFNEFKNYLMFIFASYWTIKTSDLWLGWALSETWLILGFATAVPIGLIIFLLMGRYDLHKMGKTTQYVNQMTGDIFQFKPLELSLEQVGLLKEIRDSITKPPESGVEIAIKKL